MHFMKGKEHSWNENRFERHDISWVNIEANFSIGETRSSIFSCFTVRAR